MSKKLFSLILILSMLLATVSVHAQAEVYFEDALYAEAVSFFFTSKIIDEEFYSEAASEYITRAELAALSVELMGFSLQLGDTKTVFSDVDPDSKYAPYINMASALGLFSGTGEGKFSPDDKVYMDQALKVIVAVIGYRDWADYHGGYPTGYRAAANEADILDGITLDFSSPAPRGEVLSLAYNALFADLMLAVDYTTGNGGEVFSYKSSEGETLLSLYHGIAYIDGVVTSDNECSLGKDKSGKNRLSIKGKTLIDPEARFLGYVGKRVRAYYNKNSEVIFIKEAENKEVLLDSCDITRYDMSERIYYAGSEDKFKLSDSFGLVYNGYGLTGDESIDFASLMQEDGAYIRLIDNNNDNSYDYVMIEKSEILIFASYDKHKDIIYDKLSRGLDIKLRDYSELYFKGFDSDTPDIAALKEGTIIALYHSIDKKQLSLELLSSNLTGRVDEIDSEGKLSINGAVYELAPNARLSDELNIGTIYSLCLDKSGKIVYHTGTSEKSYGYIIAVGALGSGIGKTNAARLISEGGRVLEIPFADKVRVETASSTNTYHNDKIDEALKEAMLSLYPGTVAAGIRLYVAYRISDGKISSLGLPYVISTQAEFDNCPSSYDFFRLDYLISYASADSTLKFTPKNRTIGPVLAIKEACPVYFVPEFSAGDFEFNDKEYGVRLSSDFSSGKEFTAVFPFTGADNQLEAYSTDRELRIAEALVKTGKSGWSESIPEGYNNNCLVKEITKTLDKDNTVVNAIDIIENGKEKTIYAYPDSLRAVNLKPSFSGSSASIRADKVMLEVGDVIKYVIGPDGVADKIALMYDQKGKDICYKTNKFTSYDDQYRYTSGKVEDIKDGYALMSLHGEDPYLYREEMHLMSLIERVYVYKADSKEAFVGTVEDISIDDLVYLSCNNRIAKELIVFKGGSR